MKQLEKHGEKNKIGAFGEKIVENYLRKKGHEILDTNYLKKWGEIDLVTRETIKNKDIIHFIEVKTVSYETKDKLSNAVSHGAWRPEENVHFQKLQRMKRTIETWIEERGTNQMEWQIDVAAVRIVPSEKYATIKLIDNIII